MRKKCRIWWPKHLCSTTTRASSSSDVLFGWSVTSSSLDTIDIVVAFALDPLTLSQSNSNLKELLHDVDRNMPVSLQDTSTFSVIGHCVTDLSCNGRLFAVHVAEEDKSSIGYGLASPSYNLDGSIITSERQSCGCHTLGGVQHQFGQASIKDDVRILLVYGSRKQYGKEFCRIPRLHHIHRNGEIVDQCDFHIIVYESPSYGSHHFSLSNQDSSKQATSLKKPRWVDELHQCQPLIDLDTVMLAINCTTAAQKLCERHMGFRKSSLWFSIFNMILHFMWRLLGTFLASLSTLLYVMLQSIYNMSRRGSQSYIHVGSTRMFAATWTNIQIRRSQILYWPIFLQDNGFRSKSCVEYEEKAALSKHAMWSSLAVDLLLGNLIGFAMLYYANSISLWIADLANDITNKLLRSGCVWLMGNPAGFKLNTELAEVLGIICLNAIHIWSALRILLASHFIYLVKGIAMLGILLGVTIPAALVMDMIALATLHVSTLHWLISLLYSLQIQALASLWRLFRGRKWNPLRWRLDSYDYDVEQHIVGSLLFTPLFLLLPTTSVFYIFFSMLHTTICLIRMSIEASISILHATPYFKILCWLVNQRRFPCACWFEILSCSSDDVDSRVQQTMSNNIGAAFKNFKCMESWQRYNVVSILRSNVLSIGQIVMPHYKTVFNCVPGSFIPTLAYGVLSGRGIPSTLGTGLPSAEPWVFIPYKEYWYLCRDSVIACSRH